MRSKKPVPFAPYEPDKALASGAARIAKGVLSVDGRYAPLPSLALYAAAAGPLNDAPLGAGCFYGETGQPAVFLADRARLYRMVNKAPADASRVGGYAFDADWGVMFEQFGANVVAAGRGARLQRFQIGVSGSFADIPGAPFADVVFRVREHLFACAGQTVNVCAFNNITDWEPDEATQAFITTRGPEFGLITAGIGGEQGTLFQERGITRISYNGGVIPFVLDEVEGGRGAAGPNAISRWGKGAFVAGEESLFYWNGLEVEPIGQGKVDRTFAADLNYPYRARITCAVDAARKSWMVAYPSGTSTTPNKVLIYSWADGRWTHDDFSAGLLFDMPREGVNADDTAGLTALFGTANADAAAYANISVDSPLWRESRRGWAAIDTARKVATFSGPNRPAVIETGEFEPNPPGQTFMSELWPVVDATPGCLNASIFVKPYRIDEESALADEAPMNELGCCEVMAEGRFMKARLSIDAAAPWSEAAGMHYDGSPAGEY